MSEVLSLAQYRRRRRQGPVGDKTDPQPIFFSRAELGEILSYYSRGVIAGRHRDYAIEAARDAAVFEVYGRRADRPLYRIVKRPEARPAGGWWVSAEGRVVSCGPSLRSVLAALEPTVTALDPA